MKILEEKISQTFRNDYVTKKITVEHESHSDIDYVKPYKAQYLALYKKDKMVGLVTGINKRSLIVPTLLEIQLCSKNATFGIFNVNESKMVYRGNDKPSFNEEGFVIRKTITVESQFTFAGKLDYTQVGNKKTYSKNIHDIFVD